MITRKLEARLALGLLATGDRESFSRRSVLCWDGASNGL